MMIWTLRIVDLVFAAVQVGVKHDVYDSYFKCAVLLLFNASSLVMSS